MDVLPEDCDYMYNVDCGNRTEFEPPISAPNCPRLYGTFAGKNNYNLEPYHRHSNYSCTLFL